MDEAAKFHRRVQRAADRIALGVGSDKENAQLARKVRVLSRYLGIPESSVVEFIIDRELAKYDQSGGLR